MRPNKFISQKFLRGSFLLLCFGILALPLFVHSLKLEKNDSALENRALAEYPGKPKNKQDWMQFTSRMDRYLDDHFGMRQQLVQWNQAWRYTLFSEAVSPQITVGKKGYLFFNAHEAQHPFRMLEFVCGKHVGAQQVDELAEQVTAFAQFAAHNNSSTTIAFVPTKPVLYAEYLPQWWQKECARFEASLPRVMQQLRERRLDIQVIYPIDAMKNEKQNQQLYPLHDFHWQGKGAQSYARIVAETAWQKIARGTLLFETEKSESDMQRFMPGVDLTQAIDKPVWSKSDFDYCEGAQCFPELVEAATLYDVSRLKRKGIVDQPKERLLIITDSFGHAVAPYFAPYFDEVWHISSNNMGALNSTQLAHTKSVFEHYAPTRTLYLFHDFAITCFSQQLKYCPLELPPVLRQVHPHL